jgi:predicted DNA-binding transcriptional regulator AlpA
MTAPAYPSRATMAALLDVAESTVDDMVKRGVIPAPIKLSPGCVRWCWADVVNALASLKTGPRPANQPGGDAYARGAQNVREKTEGHREPA